MLPIANCSPPIGFQPDDVFVSAYTAAAITIGTVVQFDFINATTFGVNDSTSGVPSSGFGSVVASTAPTATASVRIIGVMAETSVVGGIAKVQIRGLCNAKVTTGTPTALKGGPLKVGAGVFIPATAAGDSAAAMSLDIVAASQTALSSPVLLLGIATSFGA